MNILSEKNIVSADETVSKPAYNRTKTKAGIVHFGVGNFHRIHQAVYCDSLMNMGELDWGITGVSMRSSNIKDTLEPQDFLYTTAILSEETQLRIIGSILDIIVAPENPDAVIQAVAADQTHLVTTTITEKGYCTTSGEVDVNHLGVRQDCSSLTTPQTIYGYLAAAIIERNLRGGKPLTILCCDNINRGGDYLKFGVNKLLKIHSPTTQNWAIQHVTFISSMVDRVSPATNDQLIHLVSEKINLTDQWPVSAEPFSQWVIEDNFAGKRPPFDKVGAEFVDDIEPYEQMKLRFLNAGHSITSVLGYLTGTISIHETLDNKLILNFVTQALFANVLPVTKIPAGADGKDYIHHVLNRFQNQALPYAVLQVGTDSSQKIQQRWFPTIDEALEQNKDIVYMSFSLAAWITYIEHALDAGVLNDPLKKQFQKQRYNSLDENNGFLLLAGAKRFNFYNNKVFMSSVYRFYQEISNTGVLSALNKFSHKKVGTYI